MVARQERDAALQALGDLLRLQHLAAHKITGALSWGQLKDSERLQWLDKARAAADRRAAA
jgi:hypothetical protein